MLDRRFLFVAALAALSSNCDSSSSSDASGGDSGADGVVDVQSDSTQSSEVGAYADALPDMASSACEGLSPTDELAIKGRICVKIADHAVRNLVATNQSSVAVGPDLQPDSDRDGVADNVEQSRGTNPLVADSDQDGFSDRTEIFLGSNPLDPADAVCPADQRVDSDGDGLFDCEEEALSTDPTNLDSDNDALPDAIEVRFGTDPTTPEGSLDTDLDRIRNRDEIAWHSDPLDDASAPKLDERYLYAVTQAADSPPSCYDYTIRQIALSETDDGWNTVLVYFAEARPVPSAVDSFRVACLRVCRGRVPNVVVEVPETAWKEFGQLHVPGDCLTP